MQPFNTQRYAKRDVNLKELPFCGKNPLVSLATAGTNSAFYSCP